MGRGWPPSPAVAGEAGCDLEVALGDPKWELGGPGAKAGDLEVGRASPGQVVSWVASCQDWGLWGSSCQQVSVLQTHGRQVSQHLPASSGHRVSTGGLQLP